MIRPTIEMDPAMEILQPCTQLMVEGILDYVYAINSPEHQEIRAPMRRRSFCSTLSDYWYDKMQRSDDHGIRFQRNVHRGQFYLVFGDQFQIRVKHLDRRHLSWNHPTPQSLAWNAQMPLRGLSHVPRLELGYRLDGVMASVRSVHILLRLKNEVVWRAQVYGERTDAYDIQAISFDDALPAPKVYEYRPVRLGNNV